MNRLLAVVLAASLVLPIGALASAGKPNAPALSRSAQRGLAFAQTHCAACHGVSASTSSPNPESPPFEDVANTPGLTRTTLRRFLSDSHNFPAAMQFSVTTAQIRDLSAYIVTLQKPGYRPTR